MISKQKNGEVHLMNKLIKEYRMKQANDLIMLIANRGRRFFDYTSVKRPGNISVLGSVSKFIIKNNRVYFKDGYNQKEMFAYNQHYLKYLTNGGTMKALVLDLSEFIRTGKPTNGNNGYGGVYAPPSHWGYPEEEMEEIRAFAEKIGFAEGKQL